MKDSGNKLIVIVYQLYLLIIYSIFGLSERVHT